LTSNRNQTPSTEKDSVFKKFAKKDILRFGMLPIPLYKWMKIFKKRFNQGAKRCHHPVGGITQITHHPLGELPTITHHHPVDDG
jgi:hypothetical protein